MKRLIFLILALPLLAHLPAEEADAQLLEVKQVIHGMDCAPCARGVEASIQRLDGVEAVTISLNNGTAEIRLAPENKQTLERIRQRISDNGFSAKDSHVKLTGILREKEGKLIIQTESGEAYALQPSVEAKQAFELLRKSKAGRSVTLAGVITEAKKFSDEPWDVQVTRLLD